MEDYKSWPRRIYKKESLPYSRDRIPFKFNENDPRHQDWANLQAHFNYLSSMQMGDLYNVKLAQYAALVKSRKDRLASLFKSEEMRRSPSKAARKLF